MSCSAYSEELGTLSILKDSSITPPLTFLFNFSVSYMGGGRKRLLAYSEWFNRSGGATFIVHPKMREDLKCFTNNTYHFVTQSKLSRLYRDTHYLNSLIKGQKFKCYFSYGIPIYKRIADINWFHLSNLLPLKANDVSLPLVKRLEMNILRAKISKYLIQCDAVSAESQYALERCLSQDRGYRPEMTAVLDNGIDALLLDVLQRQSNRKPFAASIGTYSYKRLDLLVGAFFEIKEKEGLERLFLVGEIKHIPKQIRNHPLIECVGTLERVEVYRLLRESKVFISTSQVENSSNASLEGLLLCSKTYLSDIPAHRELLKGCSRGILGSHMLANELALLEIGLAEVKADYDRMTWDYRIRQLLSLCNELLRRKLHLQLDDHW